MNYVMLIYQGTTPTPAKPDEWATLSEDEQKAVYADYAAINETRASPRGSRSGSPRRRPRCGSRTAGRS